MRKSCLVWSIELIDNTNRTGSAEFVVPAAQADAFFPIEVGRGWCCTGVLRGCTAARMVVQHAGALRGGVWKPPLPGSVGDINHCALLRRCVQPRQVEFSASRTICDVKVESVVDARTGQPVKYGSKTALVTEGYHVE